MAAYRVLQHASRKYRDVPIKPFMAHLFPALSLLQSSDLSGSEKHQIAN
jgi:hemolysin-activating ACP:hemolysin acyltransferase